MASSQSRPWLNKFRKDYENIHQNNGLTSESQRTDTLEFITVQQDGTISLFGTWVIPTRIEILALETFVAWQTFTPFPVWQTKQTNKHVVMCRYILAYFNQNMLAKLAKSLILGAGSVIETRFFVKARWTDRNDAIFTVKTFRALAFVCAIGEISARGAVLTRCQDARIVQLTTRTIVARMAETFKTGRFERYLTLTRHASSFQWAI